MTHESHMKRIVESYDPSHVLLYLIQLGENVVMALTEAESLEGPQQERCIFISRKSTAHEWRIKRVYEERVDISGLEDLTLKMN